MPLFKIIIGGICAAVIAYLIFSFGSWDFNAGHWKQEARTGCAIVIGLSLLVPVAAYFIIKSNK